jgi:hypothetical protein
VLQVTGPGVHVGIRGLTITNTGSNLLYSTGIVTRTTDPGDVMLDAVTITATGSTSLSYGIFNYSSSPTMTNVTATATGGTNSFGIVNYISSSPTMTNVTTTATGGTNNYGIFNYSSSPTMTNVTATATGGTNNYGIYNNNSSSSMTLRDSFITGSTNSIYNLGGTVRVANTRLSGAVFGAMTCVGAYDATTFASLGTSCV